MINRKTSEMMQRAYEVDQYSPEEQFDSLDMRDQRYYFWDNFWHHYYITIAGYNLEIGPGERGLIDRARITHFIDPNPRNCSSLKLLMKERHLDGNVYQGFAEDLPEEWCKGFFSNVFCENTINQVKSRSLVFANVNRALKRGGRFFFQGTCDPRCAKDYGDILVGENIAWHLERKYGFKVISPPKWYDVLTTYDRWNVERPYYTIIVAEKVLNFCSELMNELQLVRIGPEHSDVYEVRNYYAPRDINYLESRGLKLTWSQNCIAQIVGIDMDRHKDLF